MSISGHICMNQLCLQVEDTLLDTRHAVSVVETIISQFSERKYLITEYHEHWKVHISTGKEFVAQWHQFVQDARKVGARESTPDRHKLGGGKYLLLRYLLLTVLWQFCR